MSFCILEEFAEIVERIMDESSSSVQRIEKLTNEFGEKFAQEVNLLYEKKLLLKNSDVINNFIDSVNGIDLATKEKTKQNIQKRLGEREATIQSEELLSIIKDSVDRKFKTDITPEQASALNKAQIALDKATPGTLEYGKARYDILELTTDIINPTDKMSLSKQAKYNWDKTKEGWKDLKDMGSFEKGRYAAGKVLSTVFNEGFKSLKATLDASFVAIQGGTILSTSPKLYAQSLGKALSVFKNPKEAMKAFRIKQLSDPLYDTMEKSGLRLPAREEQFATHWAEKIKGLGGFIRGSNDAFGIFLQNARMGEFKRILKNQELNLGRKLNADVPGDLTILKDIADHANKITGTTNLGPAEQYSGIINKGLFAGRYTLSGVRMLSDVLAAKTPFGRKLAIKTLAYNTAAFYGTYYMLAQMFPDQTDLRPNSANFMKFKNDDGTTISLKPVDLWIVQLLAKLVQQEEYTSKGKKVKYGDSYNSKTFGDVVLRTVRSKLAPIPAVLTDLATGKDFMGRETSLGQEAINLAAPIYPTTVIENIMKDEEISKQLKLDFLSFFGISAY